MTEKVLFWVKLAVGLLTVMVLMEVLGRFVGLAWAFTSEGGTGYTIGANPSAALKAALKESIEALVAIGFAVLVCGWELVKYLVRRYLWREKDPSPSPAPGPDKLNRLREFLRKLRPNK